MTTPNSAPPGPFDRGLPQEPPGIAPEPESEPAADENAGENPDPTPAPTPIPAPEQPQEGLSGAAMAGLLAIPVVVLVGATLMWALGPMIGSAVLAGGIAAGGGAVGAHKVRKHTRRKRERERDRSGHGGSSSSSSSGGNGVRRNGGHGSGHHGSSGGDKRRTGLRGLKDRVLGRSSGHSGSGGRRSGAGHSSGGHSSNRKTTGIRGALNRALGRTSKTSGRSGHTSGARSHGHGGAKSHGKLRSLLGGKHGRTGAGRAGAGHGGRRSGSGSGRSGRSGGGLFGSKSNGRTGGRSAGKNAGSRSGSHGGGRNNSKNKNNGRLLEGLKGLIATRKDVKAERAKVEADRLRWENDVLRKTPKEAGQGQTPGQGKGKPLPKRVQKIHPDDETAAWDTGKPTYIGVKQRSAHEPSKNKGGSKAAAEKKTRETRNEDLDEVEVDDMGFPINVPQQGETITTGGMNEMPAEAKEYAHLLDASSPERFAESMTKMANAATVDGNAYQDQAEELRKRAAGAEDDGGEMAAQASGDLLAQADDLQQDADKRFGIAAGYREKAEEAHAILGKA